MKKNFLIILISAVVSISVKAQENCSKYYPMSEGSSFEYTIYNNKKKVDGVTSYIVSSVTLEGSARKATLDFKMSDKKGKELFTSNYSFVCDNNIVKIDYKSLFPTAMMQQYSEMGMEMEISGTDIELPNNLTVGNDLPDANVNINMSMTGMNLKISVNQTNRKVVGKESVTTSAGTFDCMVLTETTKSKTMGAKIEMNSKLWLAEGVGMIKQETFKKNGDLMSKTELTKYAN